MPPPLEETEHEDGVYHSVGDSPRELVRSHEPLAKPVTLHHGTVHLPPVILLDKLIKIGAKAMTHSRCVIFRMAEVAVPHELFARILKQIQWFGVPPPLPSPG